MTKRVYIETTIPSYLASRPSRDLLQAARQQITHDWWDTQRQNFELRISQIVIDEASAGDPTAVAKRLPLLQGLSLLEVNAATSNVAKAIMQTGLLPPKASRDALHIAVSSVHNIDFLLTWNCRHIANAAIMKELDRHIQQCGFEMPILCTPEELLGD